MFYSKKAKKRAIEVLLPCVIVLLLVFLILNFIIILLVPVETKCIIDKVYMKLSPNGLAASTDKQNMEIHVVTHLPQYSQRWNFVVYSQKVSNANTTFNMAGQSEWRDTFAYYSNQSSVPCNAVMLNRYVRIQNLDGHTSYTDMALFFLIVLIFVITCATFGYVIHLTIKVICRKTKYTDYIQATDGDDYIDTLGEGEDDTELDPL